MRFISTLNAVFFAIAISMPVSAQEAANSDPENVSTLEDEIVVTGKQDLSRHEGMNAFLNGDYEKAEIVFEREFKSLKRGESARENAINDAANGLFQAQITASAGVAPGTSISTPGGSVQTQPSAISSPGNAGVTGNFNTRREAEGKTVLTDGKVTYHDFALTKYMAGLSEIKLGKIDEAKKSLKQSLNYNGKNYDARMRLGLIYVMERDFEEAADQLIKLDKMRKKCKKRSCEDMALIQESAVTLAKAITNSTSSQ